MKIKKGKIEKFLEKELELSAARHDLPKAIRELVAFDMYYRFGEDDNYVDHDLVNIYLYNEIKWNELYWDFVIAIGHPWNRTEAIEVFKPFDAYSFTLTASTEAQNLLFWCINNEYSLDDLKTMIETKQII